jgi:uncharacterized protein (TIGR03000 family)
MRSLLVPAVLGIGLVGLMPRALPAASPQAQPATIVVQLPADATLTIDGAPTKSTSSERSFISPPLEPGKAFSYTFEAQFVRGKQTIRVTEEVPIRAGANVVITLGQPWMSVGYPRQAYYYGAFPSMEVPAGIIYRGPNLSRPSYPSFDNYLRNMTGDEDSVFD